MGQIVETACEKCGYHANLFTGGGRLDCKFETLVAALAEPQQKMLKDAADRGASDYTIFRRPFRCSRCGKIYAQAIVQYKLNGLPRTLYGKCTQCGGSDGTDLTGRETVERACPQCGGQLTMRRVGLWD